MKVTLLLAFSLLIASTMLSGQAFITVWDTEQPGISNSDQITIPAIGTYDISWEEVGDPSNNGSVANAQDSYTITFPSAGEYQISLSGGLERIRFDFGDDIRKILEIKQWGNINWTSMELAFEGCRNLTCTATDAPDLAGVTSMEGIFSFCSSLNADLSGWNTSTITTMQSAFKSASMFNGDITTWDLSSCTNTSYMFSNALDFNQDIGGWDMSSVTDMSGMFQSSSAAADNDFNQDIGDWDVSSVQDMSNLFAATRLFNQDIGDWDVSSVTNMNGTFSSARAFNQDIGDWDVSSVTDMAGMFSNTYDFSQDIGSWDVSAVTDMQRMFMFAKGIIPDLSSWDVSAVTNMTQMFRGSVIDTDISAWDVSSVTDMELMFHQSDFNQDIGAWDVSSVLTMESMFLTSEFNQDLSTWNLSSIQNMAFFFEDSKMSFENYENTLIGWSQQPLPSNINLGSRDMLYCSQAAMHARNILINVYNWNIIGDEQMCFDDLENFIIVCKTDNQSNVSDDDEFMMPFDLGIWDNIDGIWEEVGTPSNTGSFHFDYYDSKVTFPAPGTYKISLRGSIDIMSTVNKDPNKILAVEQWGSTVWTSMVNAFQKVPNLDISATDIPDFSGNPNLAFMFAQVNELNGNLDNWDLTGVEQIGGMFYYVQSGNIDVSDWDVSSVTDMTNLLSFSAIDLDISDWDVSSVTTMSSMFRNSSFSQDITNWDVSSVTDMDYMFRNCSFNQDISSWDVSLVTDFTEMFRYASSFDQDLGDWDMGSAISTSSNKMFDYSGMSEYNLGKTLSKWTDLDPNQSLHVGALNIDYCGIDPIIQAFDAHHGSVSVSTSDCTSHTISSWKTDNPGSSGSTELDLPFKGTYNIFWIDNSDPSTFGYEPMLVDSQRISMPHASTYTLYADGGLTQIQCKDRADAKKLVSFDHWGDHTWTSLSQAFQGCVNMTYSADDIPDLSDVQDLNSTFEGVGDFTVEIDNWDVSNIQEMNSTFRDASTFNSPIGFWDVSQVTSMVSTFSGASNFNQSLEFWDVRNVENMTAMFKNASNFNNKLTFWKPISCETFNFMFQGAILFDEDLSQWDVDAALSMNYMFAGASSFNQPLDGWDVQTVTSMIGMFSGATLYNQPLSTWDVSNVTSFREMFRFARDFNQDISSWDVSSTVTLKSMFENANNFNQDISSWDLTSCLNLVRTFKGADNFNQNIDNWDVSNVTNMEEAFANTASFNQPLASWDVSEVHTLRDMFYIASSFDQSLASWDISAASDMRGMLSYTDLSTEKYDATLTAWSQLPSTLNDSLGVHSLVYCDADAARQDLINNHGWIIEGDSENCPYDSLILICRTDNSGPSNNDQFTLPIIGSYDVYWEDTSDPNVNGNVNNQSATSTITFPSSGDYRVYLGGNIERIHFNNGGDKQKLIAIEQWGEIEWTSMEGAFYGCTQMNLVANDIPDLSSVTSTKFMFRGCSNLNNAQISQWDVSTITDFTSMFKSATSFNQNLEDWDISSAVIMNGMLDLVSMDVSNYDKTIIGWAAAPPSNINIGAKDQKYCLSQVDRSILINTYGWTFNNDGSDCCLIWDGDANTDEWSEPNNWDQNYTPTAINTVKIMNTSDNVKLYLDGHAQEVINHGTLTISPSNSLTIHGL